MSNYIEDFTQFIADNGSNATHEITVELNKEKKVLKYKELSSEEEHRVNIEFDAWFSANFEKDDREKGVSLQQYRYYKMIQPFANKLNTFDDFLKLPRTIIGAMITAIEEDLLERYPHLKRQLQSQMNSLFS